MLLSLISGIVGLLGGPWILLIDVGSDLSVPSWYSALLLLLASALLAVIAFAVRSGDDPRYARRWAILSGVFAYLCCDEMLRIHERMAATLLEPALDAAFGFAPGGILYYSWVLVYVPLLLVFCLAYPRLWLGLLARIRRLFLAAGVTYVGGAVGAEAFSAYYESAQGPGAPIFFMTQVEEPMEMLGAVIFLYALMTYLTSYLRVDELRFGLDAGRRNA